MSWFPELSIPVQWGIIFLIGVIATYAFQTMRKLLNRKGKLKIGSFVESEYEDLKKDEEVKK